MSMKLIKKISVKNVCGKPQREVIGKDGDKDIVGYPTKNIMRVVGLCTGFRSGETQYGPFTAMKGQFEATNIETGEVFRASQAFATDEIVNMVQVQMAMENVNSVEFAFDVGIIPAETSVGYEYTCVPLVDTSENDPLGNILSKLPELEAPKGDEKESSKAKPKTKTKS